MNWDPAALQNEITKAVEEYHALLATERITVEVDLITAVMRLDGVLTEVLIDPRAQREEPEELEAALLDAIRATEDAVDRRRAEVGGKVTFLGHPVLELVDQMIKDPAGAARRLAG